MCPCHHVIISNSYVSHKVKVWCFINCMINTLRQDQNGHPFTDDIFKCIFVVKNLFYFNSNCTELCYQDSNQQWFTTGGNNGFAPNKWQANAKINDAPVHWCIYAPLNQNKLSNPLIQCSSLITWSVITHHIEGLVQDCSTSSALAMKILQSCKIYVYHKTLG